MKLQTIATKVFIGASIAFGVLGILMVFIAPDDDNTQTTFQKAVMKLFFVSIFTVLTSFALSVASKYLSNKP